MSANTTTKERERTSPSTASTTLSWSTHCPVLGYFRFDLLHAVLAGYAVLTLATRPRSAQAVAALTIAVAGWSRLLSPLTYEAHRGLQIEPVWATPAMLGWGSGRPMAGALLLVQGPRGGRLRRTRVADGLHRQRDRPGSHPGGALGTAAASPGSGHTRAGGVGEPGRRDGIRGDREGAQPPAPPVASRDRGRGARGQLRCPSLPQQGGGAAGGGRAHARLHPRGVPGSPTATASRRTPCRCWSPATCCCSGSSAAASCVPGGPRPRTRSRSVASPVPPSGGSRRRETSECGQCRGPSRRSRRHRSGTPVAKSRDLGVVSMGKCPPAGSRAELRGRLPVLRT